MKKKTICAALCIFMLFLVLPLFSCEDIEEDGGGRDKNRVFYEYFDTVSVIYDYSGSSEEDFSNLCDEIEARLSKYHRLFDIYNEYDGINNLATLNKNAGGEALTVEPEIIELLLFSLDMHEKTGGAVNVAMGSVLSLWHGLREEGKRIPTDEELSLAGEHISIENIEIDTERSTVRISDPEASLDVGAVAKGYAAEKIAEFLKSRGLSGYAISLGGNLRAVGTKPDGSGWSSGITNPSGGYVRTLEISDSSLVTSGNYERYYTVEGVRYHHIIDPETLMPKNDYVSLSVHTENSAVADALSTALFNMRTDKIKDVLKKFSDTEITILTSDGEIIIIEG